MKRKFLFDWYLSPKGQLLRQQEIDFLKRNMTVGCKQTILQVGALGWEGQFIDCSLYKNFVIADTKARGCDESLKIQSTANLMPIKTETIDMIILPHLLEFEHNQHHVLREVERILTPEGKLLILSFNPWRLHTHWQYFKSRENHDPWRGVFIRQAKIIDWLKLLNFEIESVMGFNFDISKPQSKNINGSRKRNSIFSAAYAVKAIKRRYHMIPLTPARTRKFRLAVASAIESSNRSKHL
jgi:SAM-dependent methyltransferase